mgnify:FL=1
MKSVIVGLAQSDAALVVLDAIDDDFLDPCSQARQQVKERLVLAHTFGVKQVIVIVNKMDMSDYAKELFDHFCTEAATLLKGIGYLPKKLSFVPVSAWCGDNLVSPSALMPWHTGPTLLQTIDSLALPLTRESLLERPLRMPVRRVHRIGGIGTVLTGRIVAGRMAYDCRVRIGPAPVTTKIGVDSQRFWEYRHGQVGDNISVRVWGSPRDYCRGDVLSLEEAAPVRPCISFTASVIVMPHAPGRMRVGYAPLLHCHTARVPVRISRILEKQLRCNEQPPETLDTLCSGASYVVCVTPLRPIVVERFAECNALGRFALRDKGVTVMIGVVQTVEYCDDDDGDGGYFAHGGEFERREREYQLRRRAAKKEDRRIRRRGMRPRPHVHVAKGAKVNN